MNEDVMSAIALGGVVVLTAPPVDGRSARGRP